jgi:hypothetical protein
MVVITNRDEVAVVKPDGTGLRKLTRRLPGINALRWSPDRTRIAFVRDRRHSLRPALPGVGARTPSASRLLVRRKRVAFDSRDAR